MLNLYAVKVWHLSRLRHFETIEVRTYSAQRAEHLASESFPCCIAAAERITDSVQRSPTTSPHFRPPARRH